MNNYPDVSRLNIFYAILGIVWSGWYAGNTFYFFPDALSGRKSAQNLFKILDEEDEDQQQIKQDSQMLKSEINGEIELINVKFRYN